MPKNKTAARAIPTFRADGRRVFDYSSEAIARLLALGLIVVARSRKGRITCAQFKSDAGANPLLNRRTWGSSTAMSKRSRAAITPSGIASWRSGKT